MKELEKEIDKEEKEMTYLERIDSRNKDFPESQRDYDVLKLEALMSFNYYRVFV